LARIALIRADQHWLHLRLLGEDAEGRDAVQRALGQATERAAKATRRALESGDARQSAWLRIAVLRLHGDLAAARKLVGALQVSEPDDARELAALDLGEKEPSWSTVIDRLRTAARAEKKLGRAQAMLVYALARAGQAEAADQALRALRKKRPHDALIGPLEAYLAREPGEEAEPVDAGAPDAQAEDDQADDRSGDEAEESVPADFREALRRAQQARRQGDLARAERLFRAALDKNPGNSEAMAGLAAVAQARGDTASAMRAYESVLAQNPGYVPALVGLADLKWQSGATASALQLYRQVVHAAPGTSYAERAQQRIDAAEAARSSAPSTTTEQQPTTTAPPSTTSAEPTDEPPDDLEPDIDLTDLPEYQ